MKHSIIGIIFLLVFLTITLGLSLILELNYAEGQWTWGFMLGGYPWSGRSFVESSKILGYLYLFGGYFFNMTVIYGFGYFCQFLYTRIFNK